MPAPLRCFWTPPARTPSRRTPPSSLPTRTPPGSSPAPRTAAVGTRVVGLGLALTLSALGVPATALARPLAARQELEPPPTAPEAAPRASVHVDTDALEPNTAVQMREKIVEVAAETFADQGFETGEDPLDPRILIVVEPTGSEENPGFVVGYSIERGEDVVPGSARQSDCPLCTRTEVVERIEQDLGSLLELAAEHQRPDPSAVPPGPTDPEIVEPKPDPRKIGPLGYAGIGLAVVGLAGVGTGAGLVGKGVEPLADDPSYQRNYRTPGFVALGIGGAVLVAGIVAIALDVSKRKRGRSGSQARVRAHGLGVAF